MLDTSKRVRPQQPNVCVVVVTYHPDTGFRERAARIMAQSSYLVIVDNGSNDTTLAMLQSTCCGSTGQVIANGQNRGIAAALNQGLRVAWEKGYVWALTLDQDTVIDEHMVESLAIAYDSCSVRERLAIIGSNYWADNPRAMPVRTAPDGHSSSVERSYVITSGSLMRLAAYDVIGPFREELFIDLVDMEYCFRARSVGFKVIISTDVLMKHPIGADTVRRLAWKEIRPTNHPAWRRYFMVRNYLTLAKQYARQEPRWTMFHCWAVLTSMIIIWLFETEKLKKTRYATAGLMNGLTGNLRRNAYTESVRGGADDDRLHR